MKYKNVIFEKDGKIARLTLNRPEKLNVVDFPGDGGICDDIIAAMGEARADDELKVLIIKAAGRAFSGGHDLTRIYKVYEEKDKEPGKRRPSQRARLNMDRDWFNKVYQEILLFPKITITQVHGICYGEGCIMSEMADMAIVADDAIVGHVEQRLAFGGSGINLLPFILAVGWKRARDLMLTGRTISGKEAAAIGWFTKSVPPDKLEEEVNNTAEQLARLPYDAIAVGKAANHLNMDILGLTRGWAVGYVTHTLATNIRFEPGEVNFVGERKREGAKVGFHKLHEQYQYE